MFRCSLDPEELMMRDKHNDIEDEDEEIPGVLHSTFGVVRS